MAIKMDGHTITALQLKASDGSEVTKQLTEEGTIPTPTGTKQITANGTYDVTDKASAVVNVPAPEINLQNKTATANGEVTADEGYDGLGVVTVAVSGDTPTYQEKTATANGVVLPDEGYDALSKVTVNVPAPVLPTLTNPASAADILTGKEAIDGDGAKLTGTCTFDADTSDADAVASDIAEGKTAYVNGAKVVGTASGGGSANYAEVSGTFTLGSNVTSAYEITHNLGHIPNIVAFWATSDSSSVNEKCLCAGFRTYDDDASSTHTSADWGLFNLMFNGDISHSNITALSDKIIRLSPANKYYYCEANGNPNAPLQMSNGQTQYLGSTPTVSTAKIYGNNDFPLKAGLTYHWKAIWFNGNA